MPLQRELSTEDKQHLRMIHEAAGREYDLLLHDDQIGFDEDEGRLEVKFGRWYVLGDHEELGMFDGEEGVLSAIVVGSEENNNLKVAFYFTGDDVVVGQQCTPYEQIEPL